MAIALMVIGLLIGGVLKGQELIENAKVTATIRQIKAYDAATLIFRNTYNALPGDIKKPNRIPNCNTDDDAICGIGGNGNGKVYDTVEETFNFFPHLTKAGMIQGPEGGTEDDLDAVSGGDIAQRPIFIPDTPIDGHGIMINYLSSWDNGYQLVRAGHYYYLDKSAGKNGQALDTKLDDGKPWEGSIFVDDPAGCLDDDFTEWNPELTGDCSFFIPTNF